MTSKLIVRSFTRFIAVAGCAIFAGPTVQAAECTHRRATSQLAGQMIMAGFFGTKTSDPGFQRILSDLERGLVGGVLLLGRNVGDRQDLERMTREISACKCRSIPFIAIDEEGGTIERLGRNVGLEETPSAAKIAQEPVAFAKQSYGSLVQKLSSLHFNTNLAPVVDLDKNSHNPVIGRLRRSFGSDATTVVKYAAAFISEHRKRRIVTVLKHFPGHGSSSVDSHDGVADVTHSWSFDELKPFKRLINLGLADAIMVGHLANEKRWGGVATQSGSHAIDGLLRTELRYEGVVMTDDLAMRAVTDGGKSASTAAVDAIKAGADVVIVGRLNDDDQAADVGREINKAITTAVCSGKIGAAALKRSADRVDRLKALWSRPHRRENR